MDTVLYTGPEGSFEIVKRKLQHKFRVERAEASVEEIFTRFKNCSVFLDASMKVRIPSGCIEQAPRLKLIVTSTTGADHIDQDALAKRQIPLMTLKGQTGLLREFSGAAEHSWLLLMACARRLRGAVEDVCEGNWDRQQFPGMVFRGKTLGLIGCGRIGSWMARYAAAFDMSVVAYDPYAAEFPPGVQRVELDELLQMTDFVSVHVGLCAETRGLLSSERIRRLRQGAIVINTSRGEIVDELALAEAVKEGRVSAVGADVLQGEPEVRANPLWLAAKTNPNIIITPHIGGFCPETVDRAVEFSCDRILKFFEAL